MGDKSPKATQKKNSQKQAKTAQSDSKKKQAITARLDAMRDAGALVPSFQQLRLEAAAATSTEENRRANYHGMRHRLERGDNRERLAA